jgi:hypothetical protein
MLNDHTLGRFAPLDAHLVKPMTADYSFGNIPNTVEMLLTGAQRRPVLPPDCFGGSYPKPKRVVVILIDAFGYQFWQRYAARSKTLTRVLKEGVLTPISALFPSTTAASISTLNLGVPPSEHSLYEWNVYIPAYGEVIQSLAFATIGSQPVPCQAKGYDPREMLSVHETIHTRLRRQGVRSVQLAHADYAHSPYNSVIGVGADVIPHRSLQEALGHLRACLHTPPSAPELVGFYWAGLDYVAHVFGPSSAEFEAETLAFWSAMDATLAGLPDPETLILFTADHGHVGARAEDTLYLNHRWPQLRQWLSVSATGQTIWPNGSPRDVFLHIVPERRAETLKLLQVGLADVATVMTVDAAIASLLFGPGPIHPELRRRLGDILVLPHLGHFIWWHEPGLMGNPLHGHHGGLSREEMTTILGVYPGGAGR